MFCNLLFFDMFVYVNSSFKGDVDRWKFKSSVLEEFEVYGDCLFCVYVIFN